MKKYFVKYYKDFGNTYSLAWAETEEQIRQAKKKEFKQITRKKAEELCKNEKERQKYDSNFAGFGDAIILPIDFDRDCGDWRNCQKLKLNGYIVDRI